MSRVYAPLEPAMLDQLVSKDEVVVRAFTVTTQLRASLEGLDEEELEYLATQLAAVACSGIPRAVVAVEVAASRINPLPEVLAGCKVTDVRLKDVVCFFIADNEADLDEDADIELSWYDVTEAEAVRGVLAPQ